MKILLVINPVSGDIDKTGLTNLVKKSIDQDCSLIEYKTDGENDVKNIREIITHERLDRILVAGGDGTVKIVAEAMGDLQICIGILPAGSANGLANDLDLPLEPEDFVKIALGEQTKLIDVICINNQFGLHISDFGLNAQLIKEYEGSRIRGIFGYAINSIPTLIQNEGPYDFTIQTEKETYSRTAIMLAIANSKKFGTGAIVNPDGKIDDGIFEILVFKKFDLLEILKTLNKETQISTDFMEVISAKKVKITTKKPVDFQIDGEYCDALTKVEAHILPKRLKIAVSR